MATVGSRLTRMARRRSQSVCDAVTDAHWADPSATDELIAQQTGLHPSTVARYRRRISDDVENGRCGVGVDTLNAVLDVLGYEIALSPRTRQGQRMRGRARSCRAGRSRSGSRSDD